MIKCSECDQEATYLHPRRYCDEHWARWWSDIGQTPEEKEAIYKEAMQFINETYSDKPEEDLFIKPVMSESVINKAYSNFGKWIKEKLNW
jgi:hypothetical protein